MLKRLATTICPALPSYRAQFGQWLGYRRNEARAIGAIAAARLWLAQTFESGRKGKRLARVRLAGYRFPLFFRPGGSDPRVIEQVFIRREYRCLAGIPDVSFIVDCGANIGCSTFFLLHEYPNARVVVAEPDPLNMALCRKNLAPFGDRVTFVEAGVWSAASPLVIERGTFLDGGEWATQVRPAKPGEATDVSAFAIPDLMVAGDFPRIDVLKVDIEGSESEVFGPGCEAWLPAVCNLAIELHGPECERIVNAAMDRLQCDFSRCGELSVYRDIRPIDSGDA